MGALSDEEWSDDDHDKSVRDGWFFRAFQRSNSIKACGDGERFSSFDSADSLVEYIADRACDGDSFYEKAWAIIVRYKTEGRYLE